MRPAGLEPATPGLGNRCSILLSYGRENSHSTAVDARDPDPYSAHAPACSEKAHWCGNSRCDASSSKASSLSFALPYLVWRDVVGHPMWKHALGRDERRYCVRVTPCWARDGSEDVRITVALETASFHRRLLRQSFVITPDNQLRDS